MLIDKPTTLFAGEVVQKSLHCVNLLWSNCMLKQVDTLYFCWSDGEIILKAGIVWVGWSFFVGQIGSISIPIVMFCYHCKIHLFSFCKRDKKKKKRWTSSKTIQKSLPRDPMYFDICSYVKLPMYSNFMQLTCDFHYHLFYILFV